MFTVKTRGLAFYIELLNLHYCSYEIGIYFRDAVSTDGNREKYPTNGLRLVVVA